MKLLYAFFYALIRVADKLRGDPVPPSAGLRPGDSERPFPGPVIDQPALADREQGRKMRDRDFEEERWPWGAWAEAQEMILDVEQGA